MAKRKLARSKEIAKEFQGGPCIICGSTETSIGMHLISVGSHPGHAQNRDNIASGCFFHHQELDVTLGLSEFVEKYWLQDEMLSRGFVYCDYAGKWFIPE